MFTPPPSPRDLLLRNARSRTKPFGQTFTQTTGPRKNEQYRVKRGKSGLPIRVYDDGDTAFAKGGGPQTITKDAGNLSEVIARATQRQRALQANKRPTLPNWQDADRLARQNRNQDASKIFMRRY